ncbi:CHAT domain-containing protein, partial [Lusitaniella coriacea LEGE 07157]
TGNSALGGDWSLEESTGEIEATLAFRSDVLESYQEIFQIFTATNVGELIASINTANANAEADTIRLQPNTTFTLTAVDNVTDGANGLPSIAPDGGNSLTIEGFGSTIERSGAAPNFRIFHVQAGSDLRLSGVTLRNGNTQIGGGAILNLGTLAVTNSTISGNTAINSGGGIFNGRTATISNSTISDNTAVDSGGGIFNRGTATISNSTISGNTASSGGGIFNNGFAVNAAVMMVNNSTISGNTASSGGGVFNYEYTANAVAMTIGNSIIAGNTATTANPDVGPGNVVPTPITDSGNNLIGQDTLGVFTTSTLVGTPANPLGPRLAALGDYGGITQTHALLPNSPALNAGNNALISSSTDQRGATRLTNGTVDIGAFESQGFSLTPIAGTPQSTAFNTTFGVNLQAQLTENFTNSPVPLADLTVTFTTPSSGASGSFSGANTAVTDASGIAMANPFIANAVAGNYQVTARVTGVEPATFSLTNVETLLTNTIIAAIPLVDTDNTDTSLDFNLVDLTPTASETTSPSFLNPNAISNLSVDPILADIEAEFTQEFENRLDLSNFASASTIISLGQAQEALQNVEAFAEIKPAVIYVFFVPSTISPTSEFNNKKSEVAIARPTINLPQTLWQSNEQGLSSAVEAQLAANSSVFQPNDLLELVLVTSSGKSLRYSTGATREEVISVVRHFRNTVTNPLRSLAYRTSAQQVYQWLIAPLEEDLKVQNISNLIFVMDAGLRSIPLAALHDGKGFIVENYSIGLMPSLSLSDRSSRDVRDTLILAMGAEKFTEQNSLPAVSLELNIITGHLWRGNMFLNEDFTLNNLKEARAQTPYGIIHLATHGEFKAGKPSNSYIQLGDTQLTLDQLRTLGWHDPPVELLVLSACRTALGDVEAELGFAGLAVAAGVKSALGSLWYVSDGGTLGLMTTFYEQLQEVPIKAEALRRAQLAMLSGEVRIENGQLITPTQSFPLPPTLVNSEGVDLSHPYYWSAFTMIGNPW